MVVDHLKRITVSGENENFEVLRGAAPGQGGQNVVGLVALKGDHRDSECLEDAFDIRHLAVELLGGLVTTALVVPVLLGTQRGAFEVEGHHQVGRLIIANQLDHGVHKPVNTFGVDSLRGDETRAAAVLRGAGQREERAEGQGMPVDQEQASFRVAQRAGQRD